MSGQLIPPPGDESSLRDGVTPQQSVRMWLELMETCHELLMAGLRASTPPDGDVAAAYRQWYEMKMAEHEQVHRNIARRLQDSQAAHASSSDPTDA